MSAYLVSSKVLANSVHAVIQASAMSDNTIGLTLDDPEILAKVLYAVNKNAVANRYNEPEAKEELPEGTTKTELDTSTLNDPAVNMQSLGELIYQCSEEIDDKYKNIMNVMKTAYDVMEQRGIKPSSENEYRNNPNWKDNFGLKI